MRMFFKVVCVLIALSVNCNAGPQYQSNTPVSTIVTNARGYLNETSARFWSNTELLLWLNNGIVDIVAKTRCLEISEDIILIAGQREYNIRTNHIDVESIYYNPAGSYRGLRMQEPCGINIGHTIRAKQPLEWYEWDGKVGFSPLILETSAGDTVTLYLIPYPGTVTLMDTLPLPVVYNKALTLYIVSEGRKKEQKIDEAIQARIKYTEELDRFRLDFSQPEKEDRK